MLDLSSAQMILFGSKLPLGTSDVPEWYLKQHPTFPWHPIRKCDCASEAFPACMLDGIAAVRGIGWRGSIGELEIGHASCEGVAREGLPHSYSLLSVRSGDLGLGYVVDNADGLVSDASRMHDIISQQVPERTANGVCGNGTPGEVDDKYIVLFCLA
ncbi:hypothetical protein MSAN_00942400 [Mycena sanguinolenta]|uniref:Uncharacterized protein n=1 Tax=Mycena sanguinolenta TaxID=230812 RepID=A0A8H6YX50_9AGAR|nr:hypothetical protein MSAN_00942400 [Mycena sanguinolenta]